MVFEVKESIDVIRINIGRSENKMAANMAEILHSNDHNSSSMTARDLMLVSFLWFAFDLSSVRFRNAGQVQSFQCVCPNTINSPYSCETDGK